MGNVEKGLLYGAKRQGTRVASKVATEAKMTKAGLQSTISSGAKFTLAIKTVGLVSIYFFTSIGLTFYQSSLLKKIHFPISIVIFHFVMKLLLAFVCRQCYSLYTGVPRVKLGWSHFLGKVGIVALVASLDIGLSQCSFQYIQVALYTVTKSTSIIFILFFAILFGLERKHWSLIFVVLMICTGLTMFTYKSTNFSFIGFSMVLSASFLSGIRWTLSQSVMQRSEMGLANPIDMIFHVQPIMIITLVPFLLGLEAQRIVHMLSDTTEYNIQVFSMDITMVLAGGILAFLMECAEFLLVSHTSSLTLSISGIVKEIITMSLAVIYQSSHLSTINAIGLAVCLLGISLHVLRKSTEPERRPDRYKSLRTSGDISLPLLSDSEDSEEELYRGTKLPPNKASPEEFFLRDNREWTSVKDVHEKQLILTQQQAPMLGNGPLQQNQELVQAGDDDGLNESDDVLAEADKLLQQLDFGNSD